MENLFEIEKLVCRYRDNLKSGGFTQVLMVENIEMKKGEITVILGPSGCGKSTVMEAISLMSDTIDPDNSKGVNFFRDRVNGKIDLVKLAKDKSSRDLQTIRYENFCFIFQDTNIMKNFNPVENVILPRLSKSNQRESDSETAITILENDLRLTTNLDKPADEYSGGQKQRFAFARAFLAKGNILFGDEPTGNLDNHNSEKLFEVLRSHIFRTNKLSEEDLGLKKIGAIVVTHNIDLALQFADKIIIIVKPEKSNGDKDNESDIGYTNPFFEYHNEGNTSWRQPDSVSEGHSVTGQNGNELLPPILNNGRSETEDYQSRGLNKGLCEKMKREINFYLNNKSYTFPHKLLVEISKTLNSRYVGADGPEKLELRKMFNKILDAIMLNIDTSSNRSGNEAVTIDTFNQKLIGNLKTKFEGDNSILEILTQLNN